MRLTLEWLVVPLVLAALAAPSFGADDCLTSMIADKSDPTTQRLDEIDAKLAALNLRVDEMPQDCSGSGCSDGCCCTPCGAYAGFAFVFARPHFSENISYVIRDQLGANEVITLVPFGTEHEISPRLWVGYVGASGFGTRYRYWQFDHGGQQVSPQDPGLEWEAEAEVRLPMDVRLWPDINSGGYGSGGFLAVAYALEVHTSDFEVTQRAVFCNTLITLSGGLRYARLDQDYDVARLGADVPLSLVAEREFKAIGPIAGLELRRPIGCWSVFGAARGSVLFGEADVHVDSGDLYQWNEDADVIGVGEAEIGLEWTRALSSDGHLFVRVGYEGQLWLDAGSPNSTNGDLAFEGFSLAFGIDR